MSKKFIMFLIMLLLIELSLVILITIFNYFGNRCASNITLLIDMIVCCGGNSGLILLQNKIDKK